MPPGHPDREKPSWEQWPGRCEDGYHRALELQPKYEQLIRDAQEDEGFYWLGGNEELLELAREHFGPRMVCGSEKDWDRYREMLSSDDPGSVKFEDVIIAFDKEFDTYRHFDTYGEMLGPDFEQGLEEDRQQAIQNRGAA